MTSPTPSARPFPREAEPTEVEAAELPERIEPEAARHHGVTLEMALEEPEVRLDVEFGPQHALAVGAALFGDLDDAVEHQHGGEGKLRVARAEELASRAIEEILVSKARALLAHEADCFLCRNQDRHGSLIGGPIIA